MTKGPATKQWVVNGRARERQICVARELNQGHLARQESTFLKTKMKDEGGLSLPNYKV